MPKSWSQAPIIVQILAKSSFMEFITVWYTDSGCGLRRAFEQFMRKLLYSDHRHLSASGGEASLHFTGVVCIPVKPLLDLTLPQRYCHWKVQQARHKISGL